MKTNDSVSWGKATKLAAVWVTSLTVLLIGITLGLRGLVPTPVRDSIVLPCYVGLLPVILLSYLSVAMIAYRVHRSLRIRSLVAALSVPGMMLAIWVWYSQFDFWDGGR